MGHGLHRSKMAIKNAIEDLANATKISQHKRQDIIDEINDTQEDSTQLDDEVLHALQEDIENIQDRIERLEAEHDLRKD